MTHAGRRLRRLLVCRMSWLLAVLKHNFALVTMLQAGVQTVHKTSAVPVLSELGV